MPDSELKTFVLDRFRGLNLSVAPMDLPPEYASIAHNVEVTARGQLKARNGFQLWSATATTNATRFLNFRPAIGRLQAIGAGEVSYYSLTTAAKIVPAGAPTWAATSVSPPAFFGLPAGNMYTFIATVNSGAGVQLRRVEDISGASQTVGNSTATCKPQFVAVWPGRNRLVQAGYFAAADAPGGANGGPSTVFFSDPLAPETYSATNFLQLDVGDGERFQALIGYQNQLFLFKSTKMYVFYGESPDDDGAPLFDYKTIPLPDPIVATTEPTDWTPVSVGPDGVYIVGSQGLWRTTGSTPVRVDTTIEPVFANTDLSTTYLQDHPGEFRTGWAGDRYFLSYIAYNASPTITTFVYDRQQDFWSTWGVNLGIEATPPLVFTAGGAYIAGTMFAAVRNQSGSTHDIFSSDMLKLNDTNSTRVDWIYQSGFNPLGNASEKRMRFIDVYATVQPNMLISAKGVRRGTSGNAVSLVSIANSGTKDNQRYRVNLKGRLFSTYLQNASAVPTVQPIIDRLEYRFAEGSSV